MKLFYDPVQRTHAPSFFLQRGNVRPNFEVPARAEALLAGAASIGLHPESPPEIDDSALHAIHTPAYVDFLRTIHADWSTQPGAGPEVIPSIHIAPEMLALGAQPGRGVIPRAGWFMADAACPIAAETWPAARAAARCALAAADEAAAGRNAYALARPPGHHAYPARAGGHCYLNNAALAAQRLRTTGATRVAVLDIDSHHGNGTQAAFYDRPEILFVSLHGDPAGYYPWYVGHAHERGAGPGEGANLNLPLPRATADAPWLEALDGGLDAMRRFRPDALVLSLGFDASIDEPLNFLAITAEGFSRAAERIAALRLPTAIIQEGGYNLDTIGALLARFLATYGG